MGLWTIECQWKKDFCELIFFVLVSSCIVSRAGVFVQLCVPGVMGLCTALQPVSAPGLQYLHCVDVCHHCMQNVVPAEVYKPSLVFQELHYGEYNHNMLYPHYH